ncbi:CRISPR locus-related protein DNA-binding protein [Archaeoglobus fulgidus DSM 8774]|uniref:CRISPR locus-related protein DNA-binding protein n=1 Tax=Archaeoglobus fulgidus DSM 8774 TaxID=1344584 RepID=A0A075WCV9_ARCFL|nr:CRISPR-associated CARF protein Csa3 [Archaeoglobus fulgidus]AIG97427.1 CRISPR locus-related protein DNA-binding protein [Archaeoglobus fulgidus DSM 8774]
MKVIVATVGGSEGPVITAARKLGLDKAILITGKPAGEVFDEPIRNDVNPVEISEKIKDKLEDLGAKVEILPVNPFSFEECCIKTIEAIEKEEGNEINVIVSGGTKIQALAASYAAYVCGCRMFYVQETKGDSDLVEIPLTFSEIDELSKARKDVLKVLDDGDDAGKIAEKLKISKKTASQYLKELREYGLVEVMNGKVRRYRLTFTGKICRARWG